MSPEDFWTYERDGWDRAAAHYEAMWTDTLLFVDPLLRAAGVRAGARVLDLACGPGFVSEAAAAAGADPVGLDVAPGMVQAARARCPGLTFVEGDALNLPFDDGAFDAVTMNFGILHLSEPERAMAQARRVLAPGGRFAFTAWVIEGHVADEIIAAALEAHALPIDLPVGPDPYRFADPDAARAALDGAGFDAGSFAADTVTVPWHVPTAELLYEAHVQSGVIVAGLIRGQTPERQQAIRDAIVEGVRRHPDGDGFTLQIAARVLSAGI